MPYLWINQKAVGLVYKATPPSDTPEEKIERLRLQVLYIMLMALAAMAIAGAMYANKEQSKREMNIRSEPQCKTTSLLRYLVRRRFGTTRGIDGGKSTYAARGTIDR